MTADQHDVTIIGAGLAGCATAVHLARAGARVALLDRSPNDQAYKRVCTHFIQPGAVPALRRLGLDDTIEAAGGVRSALDLWTRYGWVRAPSGSVPYGYSLRRELLDPAVRRLALDTPGVDYRPGHRVDGLLYERRRIAGVQAVTADGRRRSLRGGLVVAADGRASDVAKLANVPTLRLPHRRLAYYAYFRDVPLISGETSQLWFLDPDVAYAFATDDGLTLVAYWPHQRDREAFRADVDGEVRRRVAQLADGPVLAAGTQVTPWIGKLDLPNLLRPAAFRGMALVGDAAAGSDPLWGIGCGWAVQSAGWLADAVEQGVDRDALKAYRRRHAREIAVPHLLMCEYATGRRFLPPEMLMFAAAARDPESAARVHRFAARVDPPTALFSPRAIGRALRVLALGGGRPPAAEVRVSGSRG
jgi:2-polyprenyl-6-methoxyphenol hydroxylase-like FAD-dependent oxidoreductase